MIIKKKYKVYIAGGALMIASLFLGHNLDNLENVMHLGTARVIDTVKGNSSPLGQLESIIHAPGPLMFLENRGTPADLATNAILEATNQQRIELGLSPLKEDSLLEKSAEVKVRDMFLRKYFEHTSPSGETLTDLMNNVGYSYIVAGENLALGDFKSEEEVVDAWMESPGHRANILNKEYTDIGIYSMHGMYQGHRVTMVVQHFGKSIHECPQLLTTLKKEIDEGNAYLDRRTVELKEQKEAIEVNYYKDEAAHDAAVNEYNASVNLFNIYLKELSGKIDTYNSTVKKYNTCVGY